MRLSALGILLFTAPLPALPQSQTRNISATELEAVIRLPLAQAVQQREIYKAPLHAAYQRQMALAGKDCQSVQGQQSLNLCLGHADEQASRDFATFYNNLQMLCHTQLELSTLQASEQAWDSYRNSAMKAQSTAWPDGTAAPSMASRTDLALLRDRMRVLSGTYTLNIAQ